jgi:hypothetical protein
MMRVKKYYKSISPSTLMTHEGAKRAFIDWGHRRNYDRKMMSRLCSEMEGRKVSLRVAKATVMLRRCGELAFSA